LFDGAKGEDDVMNLEEFEYHVEVIIVNNEEDQENNLCHWYSDGEILQLFTDTDTNHNGSLTLDEYKVFIRYEFEFMADHPTERCASPAIVNSL